MSPEWATVLIAGVSAVVGWFVSQATKRKLGAEADATLSSAAMEMVRQGREDMASVKKENAAMRDEMAALRCEVGDLKRQVALLTAGVTVLQHQVRGLGQEPAWTPAKDGGKG
jgi:hypothetical protein